MTGPIRWLRGSLVPISAAKERDRSLRQDAARGNGSSGTKTEGLGETDAYGCLFPHDHQSGLRELTGPAGGRRCPRSLVEFGREAFHHDLSLKILGPTDLSRIEFLNQIGSRAAWPRLVNQPASFIDGIVDDAKRLANGLSPESDPEQLLAKLPEPLRTEAAERMDAAGSEFRGIVDTALANAFDSMLFQRQPDWQWSLSNLEQRIRGMVAQGGDVDPHAINLCWSAGVASERGFPDDIDYLKSGQPLLIVDAQDGQRQSIRKLIIYHDFFGNPVIESFNCRRHHPLVEISIDSVPSAGIERWTLRPVVTRVALHALTPGLSSPLSFLPYTEQTSVKQQQGPGLVVALEGRSVSQPVIDRLTDDAIELANQMASQSSSPATTDGTKRSIDRHLTVLRPARRQEAEQALTLARETIQTVFAKSVAVLDRFLLNGSSKKKPDWVAEEKKRLLTKAHDSRFPQGRLSLRWQAGVMRAAVADSQANGGHNFRAVLRAELVAEKPNGEVVVLARQLYDDHAEPIALDGELFPLVRLLRSLGQSATLQSIATPDAIVAIDARVIAPRMFALFEQTRQVHSNGYVSNGSNPEADGQSWKTPVVVDSSGIIAASQQYAQALIDQQNGVTEPADRVTKLGTWSKRRDIYFSYALGKDVPPPSYAELASAALGRAEKNIQKVFEKSLSLAKEFIFDLPDHRRFWEERLLSGPEGFGWPKDQLRVNWYAGASSERPRWNEPDDATNGQTVIMADLVLQGLGQERVLKTVVFRKRTIGEVIIETFGDVCPFGDNIVELADKPGLYHRLAKVWRESDPSANAAESWLIEPMMDRSIRKLDPRISALTNFSETLDELERVRTENRRYRETQPGEYERGLALNKAELDDRDRLSTLNDFEQILETMEDPEAIVRRLKAVAPALDPQLAVAGKSDDIATVGEWSAATRHSSRYLRIVVGNLIEQLREQKITGNVARELFQLSLMKLTIEGNDDSAEEISQIIERIQSHLQAFIPTSPDERGRMRSNLIAVDGRFRMDSGESVPVNMVVGPTAGGLRLIDLATGVYYNVAWQAGETIPGATPVTMQKLFQEFEKKHRGFGGVYYLNWPSQLGGTDLGAVNPESTNRPWVEKAFDHYDAFMQRLAIDSFWFGMIVGHLPKLVSGLSFINPEARIFKILSGINIGINRPLSVALSGYWTSRAFYGIDELDDRGLLNGPSALVKNLDLIWSLWLIYNSIFMLKVLRAGILGETPRQRDVARFLGFTVGVSALDIVRLLESRSRQDVAPEYMIDPPLRYLIRLGREGLKTIP